MPPAGTTKTSEPVPRDRVPCWCVPSGTRTCERRTGLAAAAGSCVFGARFLLGRRAASGTTSGPAFEWLEAQEPPAIHAGEHAARTAPDVFVPPNDQRSSSAEKTYLRVMPDMRPRQPRRFPVACLEDPTMALVWNVEPEPELLQTLGAMARDVGYIGHSASLVRCRFLCGESSAANHPAIPAQRRVYPGRLAELQRAHDANPTRPMIQPGSAVAPTSTPEPEPRASGWLVLEVVNGVVPDIRAAALVSRVLRRTLMSGYRSNGKGDAIPEIVSGHTPDGTPTRSPHLAIVPMPFAGFVHADGRLFGFALRGC